MEDNTASFDARGKVNLILGVILVALGILFLVGQFLNLDLGESLWPFFIIIPGLAFFVAMALIGGNAGGLAIPGSVVTTTGLILLYQNIADHWESWSYAWGLIPTAVGIGLIIQGTWSNQPSIREKGVHVARVGFILFLAFGTFFELILNISGVWSFSRWVWPLLLIAAGIGMLFGRDFGSIGREAPTQSSIHSEKSPETTPSEPKADEK